MDKLRNILHPGRNQDDEILYGSGSGSGQKTAHTGGLTGEGSHLGSSTGNTPGPTGSQTSGATGIGNTSTGVLSEASTDHTGRTIGSATGHGQSTGTYGLAGQGSHLAEAHNTTSGTTSGLTGNQTSRLGSGSNESSGLTGNASGTGNTANTTGAGQANFAKDAAVTAAGTTAGSTGFAHHGNQQGSGRELGTETLTPAVGGSNTTTSRMPGSWDDSYDRLGGNTGPTGTNTSTGLDSGAANTGYPTVQGTSQSGSTDTSTSHHLGRDAAAIGTTGAVGEGIHHHRENERGLSSTTGDTGYSGTSDSRQLSSDNGYENTTASSSSGTERHLGRDAATLDTENESGHGTATVFPPTTSHSTQLGSGSSYPSTTSGAQQSGYGSGLPDRSLGSQQAGSNTGYGSGQTGNTPSHHLGRDAAALGTAGAIGEGIHHHKEHERGLGNTGYTGSSSSQPFGEGKEYTGTSRSMPLGSNTNATGGNTTSGHHLGRDAAAVGTAGAVGEGINRHRENEHGLDSSGVTSGSHTYGSTSGPHSTDTANILDPNISGGTRQLEDAHKHSLHHGGGAEAADKDHIAESSGTTGLSDHHLGRDAAIGATEAGTVGLAEHERNKHHNERLTAGSNQPITGNTTSRTDPTSTNTTGSHYGSDAAIGAGGVGAAGLAEHEYRKHESLPGTGARNTSSTTKPNTTSSTSRTDPTTSSTSTGKDHHYGRDAAVGTGGAVSADVARRELEEYHHAKNTGPVDSTSGLSQSASNTSSLPGPAPNTAGPHSKDLLNKLDPRVIANPTVAQGNPQAESTLSSQKPSAETGGYGTGPTTSGHHYGREAAVVGGVGAAGTAAYEDEKHHSGKHQTQDPNQLGKPGASAITGNPYPAKDATTTGNVAHKGDPTTDSERSKDHHYGRDAAVAGGVGGAAYEADKYKHDKDLTQAERDAKKQQKHDQKEFKKEHKHEEKETHKDSKGGLFGFLHRDKSKKYTPEEETELDRQEREQNNSHKGRDAALGTAGAGALGAGAYEAEKHHNKTGAETQKPLPYAPGNEGVGTGAGTQNALASDNTTTGQSDHQYGRDAVLGTGAVGAAGYAAHEHDKHQGATPLAEKPVGQDIGDKLHGPERNRGVPGASGLPDTEGYGSGVGGSGVAGASGPGTHIHSEASTDQYGNSLDSGVTSGTGNEYSPAGSQGHHLSRDAAIGAGAVGATGVAANKHQKHDSGYQQGSTTGYNDKTSNSGLTGSQQGQHHTGRDAAVLGSTGAVGEHEYHKHENPTGSSSLRDDTGLGYSQQQSGTTGSNIQDLGLDDRNDGRKGPHVVSGSDGRNRLHKDPPANHPASGGSQVPTRGGELGDENLNTDMGVTNGGNGRATY
ncbi:hypothetical protein EG329_012369 [Mollisiaceae sp. DMI_Dod_QoI]|nr:hypothetical protein EG329_012369 [Helotiales sp. DMI_Dod_QoI]